MKKIIAFIIIVLIGSKAFTQLRYSERAHITAGLLVDPGGSFDFKDRIGYTSLDGAVDFVYTNRYINIRLSSERFRALDNYRDFMFAFGANFEAGYFGEWQFVAAARAGRAWRDDKEGIRASRVNGGFEGSVVYWLTDRLSVVLLSDYTYRGDQEILGYTPKWQYSAKVGVRYKIKLMR